MKYIENSLKRLTRKISSPVIIALCLPIVLFIRLIKPWYHVRFGFFFGDRIGHLIFDVEYYLGERKLGAQPSNTHDFFFFERKSANDFVDKLCRRQLKVHSIVRYFYHANNLFPNNREYQVLPQRLRNRSRDTIGILSGTSTHLSLLRSEENLGRKHLETLGYTETDKHVCLIVRDKAYLEHTQPARDDSYQDYRNSDISTFQEAAEALAERGYWVFRMGKIVEKPFVTSHPRIIDYASSIWRSDFFDIWLMAHCHFCVTTSLGLDMVADVFRKPNCMVNLTPIFHLKSWTESITVPKHLFWKEPINTHLTIEEYFGLYSNGRISLSAEDYANLGVQIVDLTPDEIKEAVLEMESRLSGSWIMEREDVLLQKRFWDIFSDWDGYDNFHGEVHDGVSIGADFLRKRNKD